MKILNLSEVMVKTRLKRSTIYLWVKDGKFPAPKKIGERKVGWLDSDLDDWLSKKGFSDNANAITDNKVGGGFNVTLRDYFAAAALTGMVNSKSWSALEACDMASCAYIHADEMMRARAV